MRGLRLVFVGLVAAMLAASAASATPPPGKGKPATTGEECKPKVTIVLKGTLASASASTLNVTITHGNRWARAYVSAGSASLAVNSTTKVRRNGKKTVADLVTGDRVLVQARACKADLAEGAMPALTAAKVVAHPATA